jgi:hypothetical protein
MRYTLNMLTGLAIALTYSADAGAQLAPAYVAPVAQATQKVVYTMRVELHEPDFIQEAQRVLTFELTEGEKTFSIGLRAGDDLQDFRNQVSIALKRTAAADEDLIFSSDDRFKLHVEWKHVVRREQTNSKTGVARKGIYFTGVEDDVTFDGLSKPAEIVLERDSEGNKRVWMEFEITGLKVNKVAVPIASAVQPYPAPAYPAASPGAANVVPAPHPTPAQK